MFFFNKSNILKAAADESGAGTFFAMSFAFVSIAVGGLAVDASNVWSVKQRLQSATDISAHAAAIDMISPGTFPADLSTADIAIATLLTNMPDSKFGTALQASDVVVGYWDSALLRVTGDPLTASGDERDPAVGVTARLDGNVGNVVPTFLLRLIGFDYWQVSTTAVFALVLPDCFNGGFIARGRVDIASNNEFINGFCIHGNGGVDVNSNIIFGDGVRVSMPDSRLAEDGGLFDLKGTGHTWVEGYEQQVGNQVLIPDLSTPEAVVDSIDILGSLDNPDLPSYIKTDEDHGVQEYTIHANETLDSTNLVLEAINIIDCPQSGLDIVEGLVIDNVIIIADCKINFGNGSVVSNAIIATTNTHSHSMNSPSSVQFGAEDACDQDSGGVTLITEGGMSLAAQNEWNGARLIAVGDVHIAAKENGINGLSVETNGNIFATSNLGMGFCNGGVDPYAEDRIIRMIY